MDEIHTVLWVGCGDAREMFTVAMRHPSILFHGCDINRDALIVAERVATSLNLANVSLECVDALTMRNKKHDCVYSTALAGVEFYHHLFTLTAMRLYILKEMSCHLSDGKSVRTLKVKLSGSREQRTLVEVLI